MPKAALAGQQAASSCNKIAPPPQNANNSNNNNAFTTNNQQATNEAKHLQQAPPALVNGNPQQQQNQNQQQQMRCYLCETPKHEYSLIRSFSEIVCRGCVNYEGPDRVELLIKSARRFKPLSLAPQPVEAPLLADAGQTYLLASGDYQANTVGSTLQRPPASAQATHRGPSGPTQSRPGGNAVYAPGGYPQPGSFPAARAAAELGGWLSPRWISAASGAGAMSEKPAQDAELQAAALKPSQAKSSSNRAAVADGAIKAPDRRVSTASEPARRQTRSLNRTANEQRNEATLLKPARSPPSWTSEAEQKEGASSNANPDSNVGQQQQQQVSTRLDDLAASRPAQPGSPGAFVRSLSHVDHYQMVSPPALAANAALSVNALSARSSPTSAAANGPGSTCPDHRQQPASNLAPTSTSTASAAPHLPYPSGAMPLVVRRVEPFYGTSGQPTGAYELVSAPLGHLSHQHHHKGSTDEHQVSAGAYQQQVAQHQQPGGHPYYTLRAASQQSASLQSIQQITDTLPPLPGSAKSGAYNQPPVYSLASPYRHHAGAGAAPPPPAPGSLCPSQGGYCISASGHIHHPAYPHPHAHQAPPPPPPPPPQSASNPSLSALLADPRLKGMASDRLAAGIAIYDYQQSLVDQSLRRLLDSDVELATKQLNYQRQHFLAGVQNELLAGDYQKQRLFAQQQQQQQQQQHHHHHHQHHQHQHQLVQPSCPADELPAHLLGSVAPAVSSPPQPLAISSAEQQAKLARRLFAADAADSGTLNSPICIDSPGSKSSTNEDSLLSQPAGIEQPAAKKQYRLSPLSPPPKRAAYADQSDTGGKSATRAPVGRYKAYARRSARSRGQPAAPNPDAGDNSLMAADNSATLAQRITESPYRTDLGGQREQQQQAAPTAGICGPPNNPANSEGASLCNHSRTSPLTSSSASSGAGSNGSTTAPSPSKNKLPPTNGFPQNSAAHEPASSSGGITTAPISPPAQQQQQQQPPPPLSRQSPPIETPRNGAQAPVGSYSRTLKCFTCFERLEDRHFVQCPSVQAHKFCFACSKESIQTQRHMGRDLTMAVNLDQKVFCPSGKKCLLANERSPWTFMNNEIETIFRESTRDTISTLRTRLTSQRNKLSGYNPDKNTITGNSHKKNSAPDNIASTNVNEVVGQKQQVSDGIQSALGPKTGSTNKAAC